MSIVSCLSFTECEPPQHFQTVIVATKKTGPVTRPHPVFDVNSSLTQLPVLTASPMCNNGNGVGLEPSMKYILLAGSFEIALSASSDWS